MEIPLACFISKNYNFGVFFTIPAKVLKKIQNISQELPRNIKTALGYDNKKIDFVEL